MRQKAGFGSRVRAEPSPGADMCTGGCANITCRLLDGEMSGRSHTLSSKTPHASEIDRKVDDLGLQRAAL